MSKRGATDQGGKDTGLVFTNEDRSTERAERASTDVMSRRKTAVPKSRRRPGAPGVESLGNIFGSNPSPAFGAPQSSTQNSQSNNNNNIFGGLTAFSQQSQSTSVPSPSTNPNGATTLFGNLNPAPSASTPSRNIFGNDANTGFSFGGNNSFNNPFAQHSAQQVQNNNSLFATPTMSTPFKGFGAPATQNSDQTPLQPSTPESSTSPNDLSMTSPPNSSTQSPGMTGNATSAAGPSGANKPSTGSLFTTEPGVPSSKLSSSKRPFGSPGASFLGMHAAGQSPEPSPLASSSFGSAEKPSTLFPSKPNGSSLLFAPKSTESSSASLEKSAESPGLFTSSAPSHSSFSQSVPTATSTSKPLFGSGSDSAFNSASKSIFGSSSNAGIDSGPNTGFGSHTASTSEEGSLMSARKAHTSPVRPSTLNVVKEQTQDTAGSTSSTAFAPVSSSTTPSVSNPVSHSASNATSNPFQKANATFGAPQSFFGMPSAHAQTSSRQLDSASDTAQAASKDPERPTFDEANTPAADPAAEGAFLVAAQYLNAQGALENLMREDGLTFTSDEKFKFVKALQMRYVTRAFKECVSNVADSSDLSSICEAYLAQTSQIKAGAYFKLPPLKRKAEDPVTASAVKAARLDSRSQAGARNVSPSKPQSNTANLIQGIVDGSTPEPPTVSGAASSTPQKPSIQKPNTSVTAPQTAPPKHSFGAPSTFGAKSSEPSTQSANSESPFSKSPAVNADSPTFSDIFGASASSAGGTAPPQSASSTPKGFSPLGGMPAVNFAAQFGQQAKQNGADALAKAKAKRKAEDFDSDEDNEEEWEKKDKEEQGKHANKKVMFGQQGFGFVKNAEGTAVNVDSSPNAGSTSVFDSPPAANNIFANIGPAASELVEHDSSNEDAGDEGEDDAVTSQTSAAQAYTPSPGRSLADRITMPQPDTDADDAPKPGTSIRGDTNPHTLSTGTTAKPSQTAEDTTAGVNTSPGDKTWKGDSESPLRFASTGKPVNGAGMSGQEGAKTPNKNSISLSESQNRPFAGLASASTTSPNKRSLFGMDGASDERPGSRDKAPTPSLFGQASQPSGKKFSLFGMDGASDEPLATGDKTPTPSLFGQASQLSGKKSSLFGMDGASDESLATGDKTPTPSLFGKASQPSGSLFAPRAGPGSMTGTPTPVSRASTPAELSDTTSVVASEDDGEGGEAQSDMTALSAAERRQEEVLFEVKAKLMQHNKDDKNEPIKTVGTGPLRLLRNRETQAVRVLMRCAPRGQVVLNATLQAGMAFKKKQKSTIQFGAPDPAGSFQMWFVRTGLDSKADELVAMLEQQTPKA